MDFEKIKQVFLSPPVAYRGKPFWSWNGELRSEELVRQTHIMKEMGLGGYFMHSRTGLITEYLSEEWFNLINTVADAAEADGMEAWIYDEDRWPSGSAGGKVTVDPQYRMKSLYLYESAPEQVEWDDNSIALYIARLDDLNLWTYQELDTTALACSKCAVRAVKDAVEKLAPSAENEPGEWKALRFAIVPDAPDSNYNGTTYIDTMSRKATDKFIELTHEEYAKHCGDRLGRSIKGIFTDEPHRGHCFDNQRIENGIRSCALCWTDDIFDEFEKRYDFAIRPILPELFYRLHGEKVAPCKLHYIDLADNLFLERFAAPINEWCQNHNLIFTGHVLHEDSLMNQTVPEGSLMRFYEHMSYPGIDCLLEDNRCYWIVKQLASVARQLGRKWILSELYGCTGWQFDFKSHKAVGDWQALFGINLRCQHLSWYTMEGQSKRDYPASILHQSPWYHDYSKVEDYFARFGLVISEGEPACDVLLLNPIESLWCQAYTGWAKWIYNVSPDVAPYEERYAELFHILTENHIDFDYGEEEMMSRHATVAVSTDGEPILRVGKASYRTVIVSNMLTIRPTTLSLLEAFINKGGKVIFAGDLPAYVNAVKSDAPAALAKQGIIVPYDELELVTAIRASTQAYVHLSNSAGETEKSVFVQLRQHFGADGYAAVVLNTDRKHPKKQLTLSLRVPTGYTVEEWDFETGNRYNASGIASETDGMLRIQLDLQPAGTRCFVLTKVSDRALAPVCSYETVSEKVLTDDFIFAADEPNVCVLDRVSWRWADGKWHQPAEVLWADRQLRSELGIEWRGGAMVQPWYAKLQKKKVYGTLELEYEFFVDTLPAGALFLAGERPALNHYKVNGVPLHHNDPDDFWIDDCFKKMMIPAGVLQRGRNTVTLEVAFTETTNIEAIYLVGEFGVTISGTERILVAPPRTIGCGNYSNYGLPFFTGNMTYHITPEQYCGILGEQAAVADRIVISPVGFTGACVKVEALGKTTVLGWEPYEADVTEAYRANAPIDFTIEGVRTNLFGPLHQVEKPAKSCAPASFVTEGAHWSEEYCLLSSGLRGIAFQAQKRSSRE